MRHEWDLIRGESTQSAQIRIAADMSRALDGQSAQDVLGHAYDLFGGRMALVSSFGSESVVLLHLAANVSKDMPVVFIDTQMLFAETLQYQLDVASVLGLRNVRKIVADDIVLRLSDPDGTLYKTQPDDCCYLRKTMPLEIELLNFDAWVTGRKRHQTEARASMELVEVDGTGRIKINPLVDWSGEMLRAYMERFDLPRHPLVSTGYRSIGCAPCTSKTGEGEDPRTGRWRGNDKTECGIHFGPDDVVRRANAPN